MISPEKFNLWIVLKGNSLLEKAKPKTLCWSQIDVFQFSIIALKFLVLDKTKIKANTNWCFVVWHRGPRIFWSKQIFYKAKEPDWCFPVRHQHHQVFWSAHPSSAHTSPKQLGCLKNTIWSDIHLEVQTRFYTFQTIQPVKSLAVGLLPEITGPFHLFSSRNSGSSLFYEYSFFQTWASPRDPRTLDSWAFGWVLSPCPGLPGTPSSSCPAGR